MINLDFIARIAERKIQDAIDEGKFDDLPGKGKPIVFDEDPLMPPHLRMANYVMKNAQVLPEWMQVQKDIQTERQTICDLRARLIRENQKWAQMLLARSNAPGTLERYTDWYARARANYLRHLKSVNTSILKFNLVAPSTAVVFSPYKVQAEMEAFDTDVTNCLPDVPLPDIEQTAESKLKEAARLQYQKGAESAGRGWFRAAGLFGGGKEKSPAPETETEPEPSR